MSKDTIVISEIFGPTIQGEGAMLGTPTLFVRSGGCDYRCVWCDTGYAVLPENRDQWDEMTTTQVWNQITKLSQSVPMWITLSGGNPAMQPFGELILRANSAGYKVAMETQGSIKQDWFRELDHLCLSPKPPSSEQPFMELQLERLSKCVEASNPETTILKVVIFTNEDYEFAKTVHEMFPYLPMYLSVGNPDASLDYGPGSDPEYLLELTANLAQLVLDDMWVNVTVTPQLHTLLWGAERGR